MKLVGISGKSGSGKDWLGRAILEPFGYRRFALAWPMKNELLGLGYTFDDVHTIKPPAVREALQRRGTEEGWKRHGEHYWTRIADGWLRTIADAYGVEWFYVSDVRFPHECEWIKSHGGKIFRLTGRGGLEGDAATHSSETALDDYAGFDLVLNNSPGVRIYDQKRKVLKALP